MPNSVLSPISSYDQLVDPKTGLATPYFQRFLNTWFEEKGAFEANPLDLGGAGADKLVIWDESAEEYAYVTAEEALDLLGSTAGAVLYRGPTDWTLLAPGDEDQILTMGATYPEWADAPSGGGGSANVMHVQDQKALGTPGGTFSSGADRTRTLNTVLTNGISGASLSSNQITLPAGTYRVKASAPSYNTARNRAWLYNVTDAVTTVLGTSEYSGTTSAALVRSLVVGEFAIVGEKAFELRHRCASSTTTNGFGVESSLVGAEIYAEVWIEKIA